MSILLALLLKSGILVRLMFSMVMKQILLLVGAKLEHIITRLAQEAVANVDRTERVKPSDEYFWFGRPAIVLHLLHFTLFQNAFEIAFFFWIWVSIFALNFPFKSKIYFAILFFYYYVKVTFSAMVMLLHCVTCSNSKNNLSACGDKVV